MTTYSWTIDDACFGYSEMVESMRRTTAFFSSRGIGSTWFATPKWGGETISAQWREALLAAKDLGHDLQLLGLTHGDCYEFGPPAWPATTLLPTLQEEFDESRDELMQRYTVDQLRARLEEAMEIFGRELGVEPTVFRAPCGAISKPMFAALREVGIGYHSCMHISASGYGPYSEDGRAISEEWVDNIPYQPFRWYEGIIEAPILNEYNWHESGQQSEAFIDLARRDLDRIAEYSPVVVLLMHTHGIADDYEHTFRLIDAVSEHVGRKRCASFATMGELAASGALADAATVEGPDILPV